LNLQNIQDVISFVEKNAPTTEVIAPLIGFFQKIETLGLNEYVKFDPTIVRGLDYYTGIVFEIFDKHPDNRRAIAGGGAYANLLQIFNEPALAGVGFGLGDVTFADFLKTHNLLPDLSKPEVDVLISYMESSTENASFKLAAKLRQKGIKTELYRRDAAGRGGALAWREFLFQRLGGIPHAGFPESRTDRCGKRADNNRVPQPVGGSVRCGLGS
jgi:histidyl-tRNA synthetase